MATHTLALSAVATALVMQGLTLLLVLFAAHHPTDQDSPRSYRDIVTMLDGQWFLRVAHIGYPTHLPLQPGGAVAENQWAFCPIYPFAVRILGALTGTDLNNVAPLVSLACALAAAAMIIPLLRPRLGAWGAWLGVVIVFAWPAAPVFQMSYSEGAGLLVTVAMLLVLDRRRWLTAAALAPVVALTRPVTLPLFALVVLLMVITWRHSGVHERRRMTLACASQAACVALWPVIAWCVTGRRDAYTATESAWHGGGLTPFVGTLHNVSTHWGTPWGYLVFAIFGVCVLALMLGPMSARLGWVMRLWCPLYIGFVAAGGGLFSSYLRLLVLAFPLAIVLTGIARARSSWTRGQLVWSGVVVAALLASQVWWALLTLTGRPYMAP